METGLLTFEFYKSSVSFIARRSTVVQGITEKKQQKNTVSDRYKKETAAGITHESAGDMRHIYTCHFF